MLEKFRTILNTITTTRGAVNLFAILKMDEFTDKWSVFVCASWITEANREEVFSFILSQLRTVMTPEELGAIARLVLTDLSDHLTDELLRYREGEHIGGVESVRINGNVVHEAHLLASNRTA